MHKAILMCVCNILACGTDRGYSNLPLCSMQDEFAKLLACCEHAETKKAYCILQLFEKVEANSQDVLNDRDCPLLLLLNILILVPSTSVVSDVSIAHECGSECKYVSGSTTSRLMERESITVSGNTFEHDFSNNLFCLNVYSLTLHGM